MCEKLILHDLREDEMKKLFPNIRGCTLFSSRPAVRPCVGCFACWLKTPGCCVINDKGNEFAPLISKHNGFTAISRLTFGGFSPEIKAVLDRSIGHILPFFRIVNGEMHHMKRYENAINLHYIFYGPDNTGYDKETARKITAANALNFGAQEYDCSFYNEVDNIEVTV
jgi:multimeric flavodoxin WrbA